MAGKWASTLRALIGMAFMTAAIAAPAHAIQILRDPDIEHALDQLASPLIKAAGLNPSQIEIFVVNDSQPNAFVIDTRHIFIHSGMILKLRRAEELQAVIAHELAHIAHGHIARRSANRRAASGTTKFGLLLALAVGAGSGNAGAATGIALGTANSASRVFLSHTRTEESSADRSALRYMALAGVEPTAMSDVLKYFQGQEALNIGRQDPYVRSHPLSRDRLRAVEAYASTYEVEPRNRASSNYWFLRAKGKLGAFLQHPGHTLRNAGESDDPGIATMRRAIAYHRRPERDRAITEIERLTDLLPEDPFVHELHGQILLESGDNGAAINAYGRAVNLAPDNALILAGYGRALLTLDTNDGNTKALRILEQARMRDARDPRMMRDLAMAYARNGQDGMASLTTAERYAVTGRLRDAKVHASRAAELLPRGSPGWNLAQDMLNAIKSAE